MVCYVMETYIIYILFNHTVVLQYNIFMNIIYTVVVVVVVLKLSVPKKEEDLFLFYLRPNNSAIQPNGSS